MDVSIWTGEMYEILCSRTHARHVFDCLRENCTPMDPIWCVKSLPVLLYRRGTGGRLCSVVVVYDREGHARKT
jgi:hypothetical protein